MKASGPKQAKPIIWKDAPPPNVDAQEAAIISRFSALKAEWSRQQKDSAPPIIASNQDDIQRCIQSQAAAAPRWPHVPILRSAAAPTGRSTPEPSSAAEAAGPSGQDREARAIKMTARKTVGVKILRNGPSLQRVAASVIPAGKPPPTFVSWAYLKLNEQAQDHGKRMFYTDPDTGETVPDSDDDSGDNMPWEARTGSCIDHALVGVAREFGQSDAVLSVLAEHLETTTKAVTARLQALLSAAPIDQERDGQEVDDVLDAFFGVFCRRCRIFNCRLHGGGHVRPHNKPPVPAPAPVTAEPCGPDCWRLDSTCRNLMSAAEQQQRDDDAARAAKRGHAAGDDSEMEVGTDDGAEDGPETEAGPEAEAAAGPSAGPAAAADSSSKVDAVEPGGAQWSLWEESMLVRAQMVFGTDSCAIARLVGSRSCREVASRLAMMRSMGQAIGQAGARGLRGRKARSWRKPRKAQFAVNKKNVSGVFKKRLRHRENELWPEYVPCNCVGSCSAEYCSCHRDKNFCEKYCACATRCSNRFRGCACRGQCRTRACPCLAAGRECDPDLCRGCASTCEGTAAAGTECMNMRLRMRQHLRIFMGKSTVHGWGAFLQGSCSEDDFLGEYTGDLITQEEADRRGRIYDRMNNSYLFNLNEQWVLDARHRGNKFRFANHSPKPNCKVRLLMVDGDWRVAVYANRNIRPNEELFYDYRYDQDVRPDWANKKK